MKALAFALFVAAATGASASIDKTDLIDVGLLRPATYLTDPVELTETPIAPAGLRGSFYGIITNACDEGDIAIGAVAIWDHLIGSQQWSMSVMSNMGDRYYVGYFNTTTTYNVPRDQGGTFQTRCLRRGNE